ncbi:hypothetical protein [Bauldia sp.]|uniref:hypothetical protein n=1 Tax=Bauldia sp. TaxID=2575872 RepID=UPI003BA8F30F
MRDVVERWGRQRWPDARVVHELVVAEKRIDMAFVGRHELNGVEIKSSKDRLGRLDEQMAVFRRHIPMVWLAVAPKWAEQTAIMDRLVCTADEIVTGPGGFVSENWRVYPAMLDLLWADEARALASRHRVSYGPRTPCYKLLPELARLLTGDEIVEGVCRELRARDAFWKADPPICLDELEGRLEQKLPGLRQAKLPGLS